MAFVEKYWSSEILVPHYFKPLLHNHFFSLFSCLADGTVKLVLGIYIFSIYRLQQVPREGTIIYNVFCLLTTHSRYLFGLSGNI